MAPQRTRRRRVRKACEPCRQRKVKCDGGSPCDLCEGYGYGCIYASNSIAFQSGTQRPELYTVSSRVTAQSRRKGSTGSSGPPLDEENAIKKQLYVLSDERQASRAGNTKFTRVDSAIAFPRSLGLSLNAIEVPRLQALAWNAGSRHEDLERARPRIFDYVSCSEMKSCLVTYFSCVNPIFGMLDQEEFTRRATCSWETHEIDAGFQVVLCGVMALGYFFSIRTFSTHESAVVEEAKSILDSESTESSNTHSIDIVTGWILRTIYLRLTSGPQSSWLASCMAMHAAESIGLHQDMSEIRMTHGPQSRGCRMSEAEIENRRRIFWLASSLNRLLSAQYGRTMVVLQNITSQYPATSDDVDATEDFITLIQTLPNLCDNTTTTSSSVVLILPDRLILLGKKVVRQLPLILLKTDALFCIYRKLKCIGVSLSPAQTEAVLSVIRSALDAATELTLVSQRWWTVISVPFQSICVLLSLNTLESLGLISQAMEALRNVAGILNTQSSDEALATAHQLLRAAEAKKRRELECLQRSLNLNVAVDVSTDSQTRLMDDLASFPSFEWPTDFDLGFSDLPDILPGYLQS